MIRLKAISFLYATISLQSPPAAVWFHIGNWVGGLTELFKNARGLAAQLNATEVAWSVYQLVEIDGTWSLIVCSLTLNMGHRASVMKLAPLSRIFYVPALHFSHVCSVYDIDICVVMLQFWYWYFDWKMTWSALIFGHVITSSSLGIKNMIKNKVDTALTCLPLRLCYCPNAPVVSMSVCI